MPARRDPPDGATGAPGLAAARPSLHSARADRSAFPPCRFGSRLVAALVPSCRGVEPLLVLVILPVLIGASAEAAFRDAKRASLAAAAGTALAIVVVVQALDHNESWSWIAAVLVSPLPIALAVGTALFWWGRTHPRRRPSRGA